MMSHATRGQLVMCLLSCLSGRRAGLLASLASCRSMPAVGVTVMTLYNGQGCDSLKSWRRHAPTHVTLAASAIDDSNLAGPCCPKGEPGPSRYELDHLNTRQSTYYAM